MSWVLAVQGQRSTLSSSSSPSHCSSGCYAWSSSWSSEINSPSSTLAISSSSTPSPRLQDCSDWPWCSTACSLWFQVCFFVRQHDDFILFKSPQPSIWSWWHWSDDGSGVAIGGGWQGLVAYINLGCYYVFGLPLGYLMGYQFNYGVGVIDYVNLNYCRLKNLRYDFVLWLWTILWHWFWLRGSGLACFVGLHFRHWFYSS